MTTERIALTLEPTETLCRRCDVKIRNIEEAFINEAEINAPYTPALFCGEECRDANNESRYESVYAGGAL